MDFVPSAKDDTLEARDIIQYGRSELIYIGVKLKTKAMASKRDNLLYRLRKKGVRVKTRERTIFFAYNGQPFDVVQVKRLYREYHFRVQLEIQ